MRARSPLEALLWLEFDACDCGATDTGWDVARLDPPRDGPGTAEIDFDGSCAQCGLRRLATFAIPWPQEVRPDRYAAADAGPSELLDAALWWSVGKQYGEAADRLLAEAPGPEHWRNRDRWHDVVSLLTRSAAALDETLRFLPIGAAAVPADAFWLPHTRTLRRTEPERFSRAALERERSERERTLRDFLEGHPRPPVDEVPDAENAATGDDAGVLAVDREPFRDDGGRHPRARTFAEVDLHVALHPCACGSADAPPHFDADDEDGAPVWRYWGDCVHCGEPREFVYRAPREEFVPADGSWAPQPEPSELIDPGEWLHVVDTLLSRYPAPAEVRDPDERETLRHDLASSASAVDEVLKFVPRGEDAVPASSFRSARGWAMWEAEPGRFSRLRLETIRDAYRQGAADLAG